MRLCLTGALSPPKAGNIVGQVDTSEEAPPQDACNHAAPSWAARAAHPPRPSRSCAPRPPRPPCQQASGGLMAGLPGRSWQTTSSTSGHVDSALTTRGIVTGEGAVGTHSSSPMSSVCPGCGGLKGVHRHPRPRRQCCFPQQMMSARLVREPGVKLSKTNRQLGSIEGVLSRQGGIAEAFAHAECPVARIQSGGMPRRVLTAVPRYFSLSRWMEPLSLAPSN